MRGEELGGLTAFLAVAEERSFTRAAARLGTSQSALSYTVRQLEMRLGKRLLTRTTHGVAPTRAGERLLGVFAPAIGDIETSLGALGEFPRQAGGKLSHHCGPARDRRRPLAGPVESPEGLSDIKVELNA